MNDMSESVPRIDLAPGYDVSRIILGFWQLAGGHGPVEEKAVHEDIRRLVEAGMTTFDCADIYTGVEELLGRFLERHRPLLRSRELPPVQIHTKYVPDLSVLPTIDRAYTRAVIDRSLRRLRVESLDLVQFHWWDFGIPGYVEAAFHLDEARRAGKIRHIGVTNFDAPHLRELLDAGIPVIADQVQYSLLDARPERELAGLLRRHGLHLLCYGTLAGGWLSERHLGKAQPKTPPDNRSLIKYGLIIEEFGGWDHFQELLATHKSVGDRYGIGIAEVAMLYILRKPAAAAIIVGTRHGRHLPRLLRLNRIRLDEADLQAIRRVAGRARGPDGPVFGLERDRKGKHGRIMKYDLNRVELPES
jgi:aryl-alcohol dehydrogenase-like predicted oxidoreductase